MYRVSSLCPSSINIYLHKRPRNRQHSRTSLLHTYLVEEDILPISTLSRKLLQVPILADSMLQTQLLPELATNCELSCQLVVLVL